MKTKRKHKDSNTFKAWLALAHDTGAKLADSQWLSLYIVAYNDGKIAELDKVIRELELKRKGGS